MEEYSEGKTHKSEPESSNRNVNTVYFIHQAKWNTEISHTEFAYDDQVWLQMFAYIWAFSFECS